MRRLVVAKPLPSRPGLRVITPSRRGTGNRLLHDFRVPARLSIPFRNLLRVSARSRTGTTAGNPGGNGAASPGRDDDGGAEWRRRLRTNRPRPGGTGRREPGGPVMPRRSPRTALAAAATTAVLAGLGLTAPGAAASPVAGAGQAGAADAVRAADRAGAAGAVRGAARCSAGARTLAAPGSRMYPDTGNGGYTSVHTAVHLVYDAAGNRFLPGNHVVLTDRATQCLTSFSLDFERRSVNQTTGPDMSVRSVTVDGHSAAFRFVQPTYPGDPHGQNDPSPLAHQASQLDPVGGPHHNPLPPACSPELTSTSPARQNSRNGTPCPANKLVITPRRGIPAGPACTTTATAPPRAGSAPATAASSPPSRWAARTGCR